MNERNPEHAHEELRRVVEAGWDARAGINPANAGTELRPAISDCLDQLEAGALRVAEPAAGHDGGWKVNEWLKKAVLLSFRVSRNEVIEGGFTRFYDKVPLRWSGDFRRAPARFALINIAPARFASPRSAPFKLASTRCASRRSPRSGWPQSGWPRPD